MAKLSLFEVLDSQLSQVPEMDGQLIVVTNTGSIYRDVLINGSISRLLIGNDIIVVDELPLAPISNKIYFLKPDRLYVYNSGWIELNKQSDAITQKQSDYEQNDPIQPDFIKNKPFGDDLPITEYFYQAETPNPISFGSETVGFTGYKISGTVLTQEQMAKGIYVTTNGVIENLLSGEMKTVEDKAVMISLPSGYVYAGFAQTGEIIVDPEYGVSIDVPEEGLYFLVNYGVALPEDLTIEFNYIGTKKIDPRFLPENFGGSDVVKQYIIPCTPLTLDFSFDTTEIYVNEITYRELINKSHDEDNTIIGFPVATGTGEQEYIWFHEAGLGGYYSIVGNIVLFATLFNYNNSYYFIMSKTQLNVDEQEIDDYISSISLNPVTSAAIYNALLNKQDKLAFDNQPEAGSDNVVKSGGIKTALDNVNAKMINGYQIRVVNDENDAGLDGYITFIIEE